MSASTREEVVIKDACILFDLIDLGLLDHFYTLRLTVVTTPEVISEITDENQLEAVNRHIESGQLELDREGEYDVITGIIDLCPGLSFTDGSVLEAATRRKAVILSSDKSLRNESQRRGLTVRGMLWILEELFIQQVIETDVFLEKLRTYPEVNKWAPRKLIAALINKYTS